MPLKLHVNPMYKPIQSPFNHHSSIKIPLKPPKANGRAADANGVVTMSRFHRLELIDPVADAAVPSE